MQSVKESFLEILSNYQGIVHKVCLLYFRNATDREDNFQEIVYQLWKSFPSLKNKDSIGSWIYAVAINTSISRLKKKGPLEFHDKVPDMQEQITFTQKIERNESLQLLLEAIYQLDEINKSIMLLYLEEKSYSEIAEIMGISESNVGVRINRAKKIIKEQLKINEL